MDKIWRKGQTGVCLEREDGCKVKESEEVHFKRMKKSKDDKNDNSNNVAVWDRLGWAKEKPPVCYNLDGLKQYNFTNFSVTLRK